MKERERRRGNRKKRKRRTGRIRKVVLKGMVCVPLLVGVNEWKGERREKEGTK